MSDLSFKDWATFLGIALALYANIDYIISIIKKRTKPHLFSHIIWGVTGWIVFLTQWAGGAGNASWMTAIGALLQTFIIVLSFSHGEKNITRSDWYFFIGAMLSIPLWVITKTPLWSALLVTFIDTISYYPTIRKLTSKPHEESFILYSVANIRHIFYLIALDKYSVTTLAYSVAMLVMNTITVALILIYRKKHNDQTR